MYQIDDFQRSSPRGPDGLAAMAPDIRARHAVARVRRILDDAPVDVSFTPAHFFPALKTPLPEPCAEADRCFALGWLQWMGGNTEVAELLLSVAAERLPANTPEGVQAAYWLARARLANGAAEVLAAFEKVLRSAQGSPLATCLFVDLHWRGGRGDRAEQVWKSVRVNKRVTSCDPASLQEARFQIRQGDQAGAEKTLLEAAPKGATWQGERLLLLAWLAAGRRQMEEARTLLDKARTGVLPAASAQIWSLLFARKFGTQLSVEDPVARIADLTTLGLSEPARNYVNGQRQRSDRNAAVSALRNAMVSSLQLYVRYALACLGEEDFVDLLSSTPGAFLTSRCRVWASLRRFCRREIGTEEVLPALTQAASAGYVALGLDDWSRFVRDCASFSPDEMGHSADNQPPGILKVNRGRMHVDLVMRRLTPAPALAALIQLTVGDDAVLQEQVGRQILRLLLTGAANDDRSSMEAAVAASRRFLPHSSLPDVTAVILGVAPTPDVKESDELAAQLWRAAVRIGQTDGAATELGNMSAEGTEGVLPRVLQVFAAARRKDVATLSELLKAPCPWHHLSLGPPSFLARALQSVHPSVAADRWRDIIGPWLRNWPSEKWSDDTRRLAEGCGLLSASPASASVPAGAAPREWFLHQAAQAVLRGDATTSLDWLQQAPAAQHPDEAVEQARPQLERLGRMQRLAALAQFDPSHRPYPVAGCAQLCDLLAELPEGRGLLETAGKDEGAARQHLDRLADRDQLPPRLAHHLALIYYRSARQFDENDADSADACWRRAWRCWLTWAAGQPETELESTAGATPMVLRHLVDLHRKSLADLLARGGMDRARRRWEMLTRLESLVPDVCDKLRSHVGQLLAQFREDLATEYLLATREAMRHGAAPEGWRADYEQGLSWLRRLLSLDRDNHRLLTALIEICGDWFLDLYDTQDTDRLRQEVDRYTPFALQLARTLARSSDAKSADLPARAALSDFFKFRGFVAGDRERKRELYRAALDFNPANENVRQLLEGLGETP